MSESQQLKVQIISIIDLLPLDGLKLLAEFVEFLRNKFRLSVPSPVQANPFNPVKSSNQEALRLINAWYTETDNQNEAWWDDFELFLQENRLTFREQEVV